MDSLSERLQNSFRFLYGKFLVEDKRDFAKKIDVSPSYLSDAFADRNRKLTLSLLEKIADKFPGVINKKYMLTGEGDIEIDSRELRPHFADIPAAAGFMNGNGQIPSSDDREFIPLFGDYSYSVDVRGDSMLPVIQSGDTAFCDILTDPSEIRTGRVYLVDTTEGAAVKVIDHVGRDSLTLHSFNPEYPDYDVPKEEIIRIARVVGISRRF